VLARSKRRVTVSDDDVRARTHTHHKVGIHFGRW